MKNPITCFLVACVMFVCNSCSMEKKFVQTELYFGLSQGNGNIISDAAWNIFVKEHVSRTFPQGFTILTSEGTWMNETEKKLRGEPSHIIISLNKMNPLLSRDIDSLRIIYKELFQQQFVLRVDKKASADF
jgi:hypothetical protein